MAAFPGANRTKRRVREAGERFTNMASLGFIAVASHKGSGLARGVVRCGLWVVRRLADQKGW